jgi:hypothetical protein
VPVGTSHLIEDTLVIATARRLQLAWSNIEGLLSRDWDLYVLTWSDDQNLLFIGMGEIAGGRNLK